MDKVYLVEASFGANDSYSTQTVKVFENEDDAQNYCVKYDRIIKEVSNFHLLCWNEVSSTDYDGYTDDDIKADFHFSIWSKYDYAFGEYNYIKVIEMSFVEHHRKKSLKELLD